MGQKSLWQCYQQVESDLRHLEEHRDSLCGMKTPAPRGAAEDVEQAIHHLKNALWSMKKELDRRKKLAEDYHQKLRQPE